MNIGKFSVKNGVLLNIVMVALLIMGFLSMARMPKEAFGDLSFATVFISVPYPGVSAEDIEKSVTIKIEDELADIDHLKRITSITKESIALISVEFEDGLSDNVLKTLYQDVRTELDKADVPDDIEDPIVDEFTTADFMPVVSVNVKGDIPPERINKIARDLKDDILNINDISKVEIIGGREREIWIEANRAKLESYGVDINELISAVQNRHINIPAGVVETKERNYVVRTAGEVGGRDDFQEVVVRYLPGQGIVRIKDVASVNGGLAKAVQDARYNGEQAIALGISKTSSGNSIVLVDEVKEVVAQHKDRLGDEVELLLSGDTTLQIREILSNLSWNALAGMVLLSFTLFLFLGGRNSIITALGIPMTFAITFIIMDVTGETLNSSSMFALVLVLGMIVDHAIVLIENIYRHRQNGLSRHEAAIVGTNEVVKPVIAATLTTIAAFLPMMLLPGIMGKFFRVIPVVVTLALVASTIEALFFIPLHFAEWGSRPKDDHHYFQKLKAWFHKAITVLYKHKVRTFGITIVVIVISLMMTSLGFVKFELFSGEALSQFDINIRFSRGTPRAVVNKHVQEFESAILPMIGSNSIQAVTASVGFMTTETDWITEENVAQVRVLLDERSDGRTLGVKEILEMVKKECQDIVGADEVSWIMQSNGPPVDKPVSFKVLGRNLQDMSNLADIFKRKLEESPEFYNISDNYEESSPELVIQIKEKQAAQFGLSVAQVGMFFRAAIEGIKVATYFDEDDELDIIVTFDEQSKSQVRNIRQLRIPTFDGKLIPFSAVATLVEGNGVGEIRRYDRKREINVSADMVLKDTKIAKAASDDIEKLFKEEYANQYPEISLNMKGEFAEFNNVLMDLIPLALLGVFLLYIILGTQFKSYLQPFMMMFTVPFALVGVVMYLVVSQTPLSLVVMYALVALIGISVNDSIVLVSFVNHRRRVDGMSASEAVIDGATTRLRPIILTSVTTMGGLLPLALGIGGRSEVWAPMASTIIFGLFFSTVGTLIVIPCIYGILDDLLERVGFTMSLEGE